MGRINSYPNTLKPAANDEILIDGANGTRNVLLSDFAVELPGMISIQMHSNVYRGKNLGSSFTDAQKTAIRNGTFDDLYVGDYWLINNIYYSIVDIDYWWNTGDKRCNTHHLVIMPDRPLYNHVMNDTNITTGGYVNSKMYKEGLEQAKTTINNIFGSSYILNHREYLTNAVTDGHPSGGAWFDSTIELPNEIMIYGSYIFTPSHTGNGAIPSLYTVNTSQLSGMRIWKANINRNINYWLRDVVSASHFAFVTHAGHAARDSASVAIGVRPVFGIHG